MNTIALCTLISVAIIASHLTCTPANEDSLAPTCHVYADALIDDAAKAKTLDWLVDNCNGSIISVNGTYEDTSYYPSHLIHGVH